MTILIKRVGGCQIPHQLIALLFYCIARRILGISRLANNLKTVGSVWAVAVSITVSNCPSGFNLCITFWGETFTLEKGQL